MEDNRRSPQNMLLNRIEQQIKRQSGSDFVSLLRMHLSTILKVVEMQEKNKFLTLKETYDYLIAETFVSKMDMYPSRKFACKVNYNSDWPVQIVPTDVFEEIPVEYRTKCFNLFLKVGDLLDGQVVEILLDTYVLKVFHKFNSTRVLDDLNILVKLPKKKTDALLLGKELLKHQFVRVAVFSISPDEIIVTVSGKNLDGSVQYLGKISTDILPPFVQERVIAEAGKRSAKGTQKKSHPPDPEKQGTYSKYLKSLPHFGSPHPLCEIYRGFGFDPQMSYSFHPGYDGLKCADEETGQNLLKKAKLNDSKLFLSAAVNSCREEKFEEGLEFINMALESCVIKDPLKCSLYEQRGNIYESTNYRQYIKEAAKDWIISYAYNRKSKIPLSRLVSKIAARYYRNHNYKEAVLYAEKALEINPNDASAVALIAYLKEKHPEAFSKLDDVSYEELNERKKRLEAQLQNDVMGLASTSAAAGHKDRSRSRKSVGSRSHI